MLTSISSEGSGDQQVLEPTLVVAVLVEVFGGTSPAVVGSRGGRAPRREVPQQRPRAAVPATGLTRAVQMLTILEVPIHPPHDAIKHVARAVTVGVTVRQRPPRALGAEVQDLLQDNAAEVLASPLPESTEPLPETSAVGGMIRLPDPPRDLREQFLQVLRTIADLQVRVQETQEHDHMREQRLPGRLRPRPAVGVDGPRGILGGDVVGLVAEDAVS